MASRVATTQEITAAAVVDDHAVDPEARAVIAIASATGLTIDKVHEVLVELADWLRAGTYGD